MGQSQQTSGRNASSTGELAFGLDVLAKLEVVYCPGGAIDGHTPEGPMDGGCVILSPIDADGRVKPVHLLMKNRRQIESIRKDGRPLLVFVTFNAVGNFLMALPLLAALRSHFHVLPVMQSAHTELGRLLVQDGILENYLIAEGSLSVRRNPLAYVKTCLALSRLRPDILGIYGKLNIGYSARLGLLRAGRVLFCHPRGLGPSAAQAFEVLPPTGNLTRDYLQFAAQLAVPTTSTRIRLTDRAKGQLEQAARPLLNMASYAVVAPWTSDLRWDAPLQFFRECIQVIVEEGRLPVVITGLPQHRSVMPGLLRGLPGQWVMDLVGATTLLEMLGVLAGARFLLTNDGGTFHLARLVGTPAIVAFGPETPEVLFHNSSEEVVPVYLGLSCSPCEKTPRRYQCPGAYFQCLRGLTVANAKDSLLAACRAPVNRAR
jgi:ADP-heptose:LPS heptosyltransferase